MTIRDLGYRPYDGVRLPPANNTWVMLRHGITRAWASWWVKLACLFGLGPMLVFGAWVGFRRLVLEPAVGGQMPALEGEDVLRDLFRWQTWLFVSVISVSAGASAIAEDIRFKAFQFYFAKAVTPAQYLAGRVLAVSFFVFVVVFVPAMIVDLALVGTASEEVRLEDLGLIAPIFVYSLLIAAVIGAGSVGMSALSGSRALTMSAWLLLFIVPHALAALVEAIGDWPWLYLASFTGLLGTVADALFKVETESELKWYHAAPILLGIVAAALGSALYRLRRAEVIT